MKLSNETEHHFELSHPDGHKVIIAKAALSEPMKKKIQAMSDGGQANPKLQQSKVRNYDNGTPPGGAGSEDDNSSILAPVDNFVRGAVGGLGRALGNSIGMYGNADPNVQLAADTSSAQPDNSAPDNSLKNPVLDMSQMSQQQSSSPEAVANAQNMDMTNAGFKQQLTGMGEEARAENQIGAENAPQLQARYGDMMSDLSDFNTAKTDWEQKVLQTQKDLADPDMKLKPAQLFHSPSALGNIGTALGLFLGGVGGAVTKQGNTVLDQLNKEIDRDMKAQQENIGTKKSLLDSQMQMYRSLPMALEASRLHQLAAASMLVDATKEKYRGPVADAKRDQLQGALKQEMGPRIANLSFMSMMMKKMSQGQQVDPSLAVRFMVPEKQQGDAYKDLKELQEMKKSGDDALDSFHKLDQMTAAGLLTPGDRAVLVQPALAKIVHDSAGRITDADTKMFEPLFPSKGDLANTRMDKLQKLTNLFNNKMNSPVLDAYGIPKPKLNSGPMRAVKQGPGFSTK